MVDFKNHSICDTDMLIKLQLGKVFCKFKEKEVLLFIADSVKDELLFICNSLHEYKYLYSNLFDNSDPNIKVIYASDFSPIEQRMINSNLMQYGIRTNIGNGKIEKNVGEFVTTLYAVYKNIGIVRTCDGEFIRTHSEDPAFNQILFKTLNETLSSFLNNKDRIKVNKLIEKENKLFSTSKANSRKPTIDDLINRFNNLKLS